MRTRNYGYKRQEFEILKLIVSANLLACLYTEEEKPNLTPMDRANIAPNPERLWIKEVDYQMMLDRFIFIGDKYEITDLGREKLQSYLDNGINGTL